MVEFLNEVNSVGCDLYIHQSGLDTSTPSGKMMFQMIGVFSEFEREMISERVKLGLERVKSQGIKLGRRKVDNSEIRNSILNLKSKGMNLSNISKHLGIGRTSVYRILGVS